MMTRQHRRRAIRRMGTRNGWCAGAFVCTLALALALALAPAAAGAATAPSSDPFYKPPANLGKAARGAILREREVSMVGPQADDTAHAYQLMFRTTDATAILSRR